MTGRPTLLVQLDDGTDTFPHNITAYVLLQAGWSLDRGRRDEFSEVDASIARMTLNNADGRFTIGSATYGITVDQRIRITETTLPGGTPRKRFTGYVQEWPVEWDDPSAMYAPCRIVASDRQARLTRQTLDNVLASELLRDAPTFLYMLGEEAGATGSGDTSGNMSRSLAITGTGSAMTFGSTALLDDTGVLFAADGQYLRASLADSATELQTLGFTVLTTSTPATDLVFVTLDTNPSTTYSVTLGMTTTGMARATVILGIVNYPFTHTTPINDGEAHRVSFRFNPATGDVALTVDDDDQADTLGTSFPVLTFGRVSIGPVDDGAVTMLAVAGFGTSLATARVQAHYAAQGTLQTDSADERIERLAAYGGLSSGDLDLEAGALTSVDEQTTDGASLWAAMTEVVDAEGGALFIAPDGRLTLQNRYHRAITSTTTAAVQLDSEDINHDDLRIVVDKQYLSNVVRGSRRDGAQQTYRNPASILKYGEYPQDYSSLLVTTDDEVADRVTWHGTAYGEVEPRINSVTVDMMTLASTVDLQDLMDLEIGDLIRVTGLPATASPVTTADLIVEGISEQQSVNSWTLTLNTVAADLYRAWILEDPVYGVLDSTTILHY